MTRQGVDRYELAARLGCTPENVYQLLHSNPGLRLFTAERLAEALGLRLEIRLVAREPASEATTTENREAP